MISKACVLLHKTMANNNHESRTEPVLSLELMADFVALPEPQWRSTVISLFHEGQQRMTNLDDRMREFEASQQGIRTNLMETHKLAETIAQDTAEFRVFLNNSRGAFKFFQMIMNSARAVVKWILLPIVGVMILWRVVNGQSESTILKALIEFLKQ